MTVPALVVGFVKSPMAPIVGLASIVLGVAESDESWVAPIVGVGGGAAILIMAWLANAVKRVMERWLEAQGQKLIDLPTAEQIAKDNESLTDTLTKFTEAAEKERGEMSKFRETLAATLADHNARIIGLERRQRNTGEVRV